MNIFKKKEETAPEKPSYSNVIDLKNYTLSDEFWLREATLVKKEVIPYQWNALNDNVPGAAKSYCMRNFKVAGKVTEGRRNEGYEEKLFPTNIFEVLPSNTGEMEDRFYGFVFQDTDFSKWIEAVAYSLTQFPDEELEKTADEAIDIVCAAQAEDGYLDTYYIINDMSKRFTNLRDHHELYCFGHLTEGAVAYYKATGKDKLLKAAERFADCIDGRFGPEPEKCKGYPGHEIAEMALCKLYEATGNYRYLNLSKFFIDERGKQPYYWDTEPDHPFTPKPGEEKNLRYHYHQAQLPVRDQSVATGHAVRAVYLYSGMADVARLSNDEELIRACDRLWDNITTKQMYITGGIGSTHEGEAFTYDYDLPNDTNYSETCASIGLVFFARRMLQLKNDSKYSDIMERALYNGILSGMAIDGKSFFYVNPLESNPSDSKNDPGKFHIKSVRQKWFGCACCPPNIARLLSSLGEYAYTENDNGFFVHLYMGGTYTKTVDGQPVKISIASKLPLEGDVEIKIESDADVNLKLGLRIPSWCDNYTVAGADFTKPEDGYVYTAGFKKGTTVISLKADMPVRKYSANPKVRKDRDRIAYMRGPIVFCAEEIDNGSDLPSLYADREAPVTVMMESLFKYEVPVLYTFGIRKVYEETENLYLTDLKVTETQAKLKLIPYYLWNNRGEGEMCVWLKEK